MKSLISLLLAILLAAAVFCGCAKSEPTVSTQTDETAAEATVAETVRAAETIAETEPVETEPIPEETEAPATEPPTEAPKAEYYGVDLAKKSLSDIVDIMGRDFDVEIDGRHAIYYTSGCVCFYNNDVLPGFAFFINADPASDEATIKQNILNGDYSSFAFIGVFDNAKYDERISADMTYVQVSEIIGYYDVMPLFGAGGYFYQELHNSGNIKDLVCYNMSNSLSSSAKDTGSVNTEKAREEDPSIFGIVVFP